MIKRRIALAACVVATAAGGPASAERVRARDLGVAPGVLQPGPLNAITDVVGVRVGHATLNEGDDVRTGVTAILPHGGDLYQDKTPAAVVVGNGFGKLMGATQIRELGEIETPILLTNTLSVPEAAIAVIEWTLERTGDDAVFSVNAVVGETNDAGLNNIRKRALTPAHARAAIDAADGGPVAEGAIGAGRGTWAFGWKGGIGTSSRALPASLGGYVVCVLVQSNFNGVLSVDGVPVGVELGEYYLREHVEREDGDGSIMVVVATDAPLSDRNLERLGRRALGGLARTGASLTNGSGDYVVAFSTAEGVRRTPARRAAASAIVELPNDRFSPLAQATIEATEEAILNSLFMAETVAGYSSHRGEARTLEALPLDRVREILEAYGR
ncbi:MAG: P1 family peptidase [Parvularculaceae bacterium]